jgi:hypothetical protein
VGQTCTSGKCENTSWTAPSAATCITCHDSAAAFGHAQVNTWTDAQGNPVETCEVCHGTDAQFSVASVHSLLGPVPTYSREP